jgi:hypothetical protein
VSRSNVVRFEAPLVVPPKPARAPKARRTDTQDGRFYFITDLGGQEHKLPSATTFLSAINKPALVGWAANQERALCIEAATTLYADAAQLPHQLPEAGYRLSLEQRIGVVKAHVRAKEKAGDIGQQTHALIEWTLKRALGIEAGPEPAVCDQAQWAFMAWEDWAKSVQLRPRFVENTVYSLTHQYAGTIDLIADVDGRDTVVDFKTGKKVYGEARLQNVAYRAALVEMGHAAPDIAGKIVRLPKNTDDPAFEVVDVEPIAALLPIVLATRTLWNFTEAEDQAYRKARRKTTPTTETTTPIVNAAPAVQHPEYPF